jgi:hypothetical protein
MYLKAIIVFALFFVTIRMYRSLWRRYMKVQEPRVRTGACVLTELSLLFRICVLKFSAMSRLQVFCTQQHIWREEECVRRCRSTAVCCTPHSKGAVSHKLL